jgi:hypothetical protein
MEKAFGEQVKNSRSRRIRIGDRKYIFDYLYHPE